MSKAHAMVPILRPIHVTECYIDPHCSGGQVAVVRLARCYLQQTVADRPTPWLQSKNVHESTGAVASSTHDSITYALGIPLAKGWGLGDDAIAPDSIHD